MNPNKKRLRRTMMFLNAQKPGLIKDPYIYKPDSIMLDLEDAVAENQKDVARFSLYHALKTIDYRGCERVVRINALDTPYWKEDIRCEVAGGCVVLPVDPVGDQHGRGHERLQQAAVGVSLGVIVVQKAASLQCCAQRPVPGRDDEGCVARQAPFRACLGAIVGAHAQLLQQIVVRHPWVDVQVRCSFSADLVTGMVQHRTAGSAIWQLKYREKKHHPNGVKQ